MSNRCNALTVRLALTSLLLSACEREPEEPQGTAQQQTADACRSLQLSEDQLGQKISEAQGGDMSAQEELLNHFQCDGDEREAAIWEERLIEQGHADTMGFRSSKLFNAAKRLRDGDPAKLAMLKQALELENRARRARAGKVDNVVVNGRTIQVDHSVDPDDGTRIMEAELARVRVLQGN